MSNIKQKLDNNKGTLETIILSRNKEYQETLIDGLKEDVSEGIKEKDVNW